MRQILIGATALTIMATPACGQEAQPANGGEPAVAAYARGDYLTVIQRLEPAEQAGKTTLQQRMLLARAYLHVDRPDASLGTALSVVKDDPDNADANALIGQVLFDTGDLDRAIKHLKTAYRLKPGPPVTGLLGQACAAVGDTTNAFRYLTEALAEDVRDPANSFGLGELHLARGSGALAEKHLLVAQEAGMQSPQLHMLLGQAYLIQRKLTGPILVRRYTNDPEPGQVIDEHVVLAALPSTADRYKVCTRYCALYEGLVLLADQPENANALYMAAAGWLAADQPQLAAEHLARLQAIESSSRVARLAASLALARRDWDRLQSDLQTGQHDRQLGAKDVVDIQFQAALILRARGHYDRAIALLKSADHLDPVSANVLRALASLSAATDRADDAIGYHRRLIELFPDAADIDDLLNALQRLEDRGATR